jgi:hypothetical protein
MPGFVTLLTRGPVRNQEPAIRVLVSEKGTRSTATATVAHGVYNAVLQVGIPLRIAPLRSQPIDQSGDRPLRARNAVKAGDIDAPPSEHIFPKCSCCLR